MIQPKEIREEYNAEGCNHRLGEGWKLLKIGQGETGPVYVMGKTSGKAKHTWAYGRTVQTRPYESFKVSNTREFNGEVSAEEAMRILFDGVEANIKRIHEELRNGGKLRE
jgi:hypothetical protein